jgi:hypothetical protein
MFPSEAVGCTLAATRSLTMETQLKQSPLLSKVPQKSTRPFSPAPVPGDAEFALLDARPKLPLLVWA